MNKAHIDLSTGKIYGAKKGSWKWYHEKGHIEFNNNEKLSFFIMLNEWSVLIMQWILVACFVNRLFIFPAIFVMAFQMLFFVYEEWWCNQYATKKVKAYKP